jgi:hypothetical protein
MSRSNVTSENDVVFGTMFLRFPSLCLSQALD